MRLKPLVMGVALLGAVTFGAVSASADQTFRSGLYQNQPYSCANGSRVDPSGQSFGTFQVTETHGPLAPLVEAYVAVDNVKPNLMYSVFVTESGLTCIQPPLTAGYETTSFWVGPNSHGSVHFEFWAHTREQYAWVTVKHGNVMTVRSTALPINR